MKPAREGLPPQLRKALHLYCEQLAKAMTDEGMTIQEVLSKSVERQWTKDSVKELLIKDLLKRAYGKDSTEKATANEITAVYDSINKHTSTHWGVHVPFPSEEEISRSQQ